MKKTFFLAMAAALVMTSCNNGGNTAEQKSDAPQSSDLKIAYVDIEELDSTYKFCTDFKAEFEKKTKNADNTLNQKGQALQNQAAQFQQNLQNNKYTQQQAQSVNASLQKQQADLQQLQQRLAAELQAESEKYSKALRDSIQHFLGDHFLGRDDNLASGSVHDRLSQDAAADAALPAQLLGELVTAHGSQVIALGVEKERIQELLGVVLVGRLTGAQTLVDLHHSFALALDLLTVTLDGGSNTGVIAKELENLLVGSKAQSTDEISHGHLAGAVNADGHDVVGIRLQLDPGPTVRDDCSIVELLAGGVDLLAVIGTGRTNQLADDDTLCTIDDEGASVSHQGEIPHENFLLLDFTGLAVDETDIDAQGRSPGHIAFLALIEVILRLSHRKAFEGEDKISREILNWRNVTEDLLQPLIQEPLVARPLDIQQVRHFHDFLDSGVAIPGSFAHRHRIKH